MKVLNNKNLIIFISIFILLLFGIYTKLYYGIFEIFIRWWLGDIIFTIAGCLIIFLIKPLRKYSKEIAIMVFLLFSFLEFLQLCNVSYLNAVKKIYLLQYIIGIKYDWIDFFCYFIGVIIAFYWMKFINQENEYLPFL